MSLEPKYGNLYGSLSCDVDMGLSSVSRSMSLSVRLSILSDEKVSNKCKLCILHLNRC